MTLTGKLRTTALVVCTGWALALLFWRPAPFTITFDDAYYYFAIGRNLAHGYGSTFDRVDLTNGYHPLWQGISVIPFWLGLDDLAAVRSLLLLQLALWAATLWLVLGRVGDAVAGWPALSDATPSRRRAADLTLVVVTVLLLVNPFLLKMVVNGLESGVEVPVLALLLVRAVSCRGRFVSTSSRGHRLVTGALLALAFLARTDAVLLFAAIGLWCLLDKGPDTATTSLTVRAVRTVEVLAIPAVVVAVYLGLNAVWFHTALQISGTVKRLPLTAPRLIVAGVWVVVAVAALLACRRAPSKRSKVLRVRRFLRATGWCAAFCILLRRLLRHPPGGALPLVLLPARALRHVGGAAVRRRPRRGQPGRGPGAQGPRRGAGSGADRGPPTGRGAGVAGPELPRPGRAGAHGPRPRGGGVAAAQPAARASGPRRGTPASSATSRTARW